MGDFQQGLIVIEYKYYLKILVGYDNRWKIRILNSGYFVQIVDYNILFNQCL